MLINTRFLKWINCCDYCVGKLLNHMLTVVIMQKGGHISFKKHSIIKKNILSHKHVMLLNKK